MKVSEKLNHQQFSQCINCLQWHSWDDKEGFLNKICPWHCTTSPDNPCFSTLDGSIEFLKENSTDD